MNSIQRLSRRYDALGTAQSHSPTPTEHLQRHPPSSYSTPFQALWHWVYAQWLVALFIRRVASGAELLVDVDDSGVEKGRRRGNDAVAGLEAPLIEEDDEYEGEEESPLRDKAERVKRERARLAAVAAAGDVSSSGPSLPDGQPSTSSSTRQSPPVPESPSPSTRPAFSLSTFSLEETIPIDSATPSRSSSSSTWPSPTLQFTPPTPHQPPTPLPPPQTLLLNPYATSFLTTHTRSSRRRGREPENQTSDSPPLGASSSGSSIINTTPPASRALTPTSTPPIPRSRRPVHRPKTLVLDLDETLIHSTSKAPANYYASYGQGLFSAGGLGFGIGSSGGFGFGGNTWGSRRGGPGHMVEVVLNGRSTLYHVYKRPFVDYFLKKASAGVSPLIHLSCRPGRPDDRDFCFRFQPGIH